MARIDKAPEAGKFRARAAASLDATAGAWGVGDLLNITIDASGELVAASATNVDGVILTSEGQAADAAANKTVIGGRMYTVFFFAEVVEVGDFVAPTLAAGNLVYAAAAGDVTASPGLGAVFIGHVMDSGERMVIHLNGRIVSV